MTRPLLQQIADDLGRLVNFQAAGPVRWLDVDAAATYASVSTKTIRRWIDAGSLESHRPCDKVLIDRNALDRLIEGATVQRRSGRGKNRGAA